MSIYKQSQERAVIPFGISGEIHRNGGRACVFFSAKCTDNCGE